MPISHTAVIFVMVFTTVQNASTNSGARAAHQRCSAPKVRAGETAVMTFFVRKEINASSDINFVTMTRASAPDHDILICDRKSPLVCKPTSNLYQTDSSIDRNRITLRIPKVTRAFEDKYVLKIYVNGHAEPTDFCHLHVQGDRTCARGTWMCRNGTCISVYWRCDTRNDCGDNSDEQHCGEWVCPVGQWKCRDNMCISSSQRCDNRNDCSDDSDEDNCDVNGEWVCPVGQWKCRDNMCISSSQRCDNRNDCSDDSDEDNCDVDGVNTDADSGKTEPWDVWQIATISLLVLLASFIVIVVAVCVHNKRSSRLLSQDSVKLAALSTNAVQKRGREGPYDQGETDALVPGTIEDLAEEEGAGTKETYQRRKGSITLSEERSITLSEEKNITLSEERSITLSEEKSIAPSEERSITLSEEHNITMSEEVENIAEIKRIGVMFMLKNREFPWDGTV